MGDYAQDFHKFIGRFRSAGEIKDILEGALVNATQYLRLIVEKNLKTRPEYAEVALDISRDIKRWGNVYDYPELEVLIHEFVGLLRSREAAYSDAELLFRLERQLPKAFMLAKRQDPSHFNSLPMVSTLIPIGTHNDNWGIHGAPQLKPNHPNISSVQSDNLAIDQRVGQSSAANKEFFNSFDNQDVPDPLDHLPPIDLYVTDRNLYNIHADIEGNDHAGQPQGFITGSAQQAQRGTQNALPPLYTAHSFPVAPNAPGGGLAGRVRRLFDVELKQQGGGSVTRKRVGKGSGAGERPYAQTIRRETDYIDPEFLGGSGSPARYASDVDEPVIRKTRPNRKKYMDIRSPMYNPNFYYSELVRYGTHLLNESETVSTGQWGGSDVRKGYEPYTGSYKLKTYQEIEELLALKENKQALKYFETLTNPELLAVEMKVDLPTAIDESERIWKSMTDDPQNYVGAKRRYDQLRQRFTKQAQKRRRKEDRLQAVMKEIRSTSSLIKKTERSKREYAKAAQIPLSAVTDQMVLQENGDAMWRAILDPPGGLISRASVSFVKVPDPVGQSDEIQQAISGSLSRRGSVVNIQFAQAESAQPENIDQDPTDNAPPSPVLVSRQQRLPSDTDEDVPSDTEETKARMDKEWELTPPRFSAGGGGDSDEPEVISHKRPRTPEWLQKSESSEPESVQRTRRPKRIKRN